MELKFEQTVNAPASQVFRAFTSATALREWLCDAALADARPAGRLYLWWHDGYYASGEFTTLTLDEQIAFTWHGRNEPGTTQVHVSLEARGSGTRVMVTHTQIGSSEPWAEVVEQFERGWAAGLENLISVLETGQDLRFVRRPMLGITLDEFNAEVAAQLGVPVIEGIRLEGVIEGMGAQAAGLQQDDVIVGIAGMEVTNWPTLNSALQAHRADDQVQVIFYRGNEQKATTMTLSRRPLPEVPPTPEALAGAIRQVYDELDVELAQLFDQVSDAEAAYRLAPDQWNAKETLAHLIASQRETHCWLADLINDDERWSDRFENPTNVPARLKATLAAFPTIPALLEELKRNKAETVATLAALPPEFVARKGSYLRLGYALLELPGHHTRTHLDQIRAAVEAAKSDPKANP